MTVEQLMHMLNALPLDARHDHVVVLDGDSAIAFDLNSLNHEPAEGVVWISVGML
ncbi:hypothetical protein [Streptomyces sp. SM8]|uniref:hypothetical protein n=1 Tax=Streptomyces sp. SM8 TaxID=1195457 RepID=UPI0002831121|nr:hypothetical protein [Streptomyces sp. SM8]